MVDLASEKGFVQWTFIRSGCGSSNLSLSVFAKHCIHPPQKCQSACSSAKCYGVGRMLLAWTVHKMCYTVGIWERTKHLADGEPVHLNFEHSIVIILHRWMTVAHAALNVLTWKHKYGMLPLQHCAHYGRPALTGRSIAFRYCTRSEKKPSPPSPQSFPQTTVIIGPGWCCRESTLQETQTTNRKKNTSAHATFDITWRLSMHLKGIWKQSRQTEPTCEGLLLAVSAEVLATYAPSDCFWVWPGASVDCRFLSSALSTCHI